MDSKSPIGVFDSGVGGLTVLDELIHRLPHENFIYIGDTKNSPYGEKTDQEIIDYVSNIVRYLEKCDVKQVVIACNTATVNSEHVADKKEPEVIGIVYPTAFKAINTTKTKNVLVLATPVTIRKGLYQTILKKLGINVYAKACPKFVPIIEANKMNTKESLDAVREVLEPFKGQNIDTVLMGCTHYGLLAKEIKEVMGDVNIVDSGNATYEVVHNSLQKNHLLNNTKEPGHVELYTTGDVKTFKKSMSWFNKRIDSIDFISV